MVFDPDPWPSVLAFGLHPGDHGVDEPVEVVEVGHGLRVVDIDVPVDQDVTKAGGEGEATAQSPVDHAVASQDDDASALVGGGAQDSEAQMW